MTPNDHYSGRIAPLPSKRFILYIYSTNTGTEYFKHGIYSPIFPLQNAVCFIILTYLFPVLFTFYIQGVLKLKKINSGAKSLTVPQSFVTPTPSFPKKKGFACGFLTRLLFLLFPSQYTISYALLTHNTPVSTRGHIQMRNSKPHVIIFAPG